MPAPALPPRGMRGVASPRPAAHLQRLALVSVRPAHPQHGVEHVEATARPSALGDRAVALGWARARVVVMDAEQGQSGQRLVTRVGLQRVWAAGSLAQGGLRLGRERSRVARSHKAWPPWLALGGLLRPGLADAAGL
jgi:hypothetical protein